MQVEGGNLWQRCLGGLASLVTFAFLVGGAGASVDVPTSVGVLALLLTLRGGSYVAERAASS